MAEKMPHRCFFFVGFLCDDKQRCGRFLRCFLFLRGEGGEVELETSKVVGGKV